MNAHVCLCFLYALFICIYQKVIDSFFLCMQDSVIKAFGDLNMHTMKRGEVLQLERKGYYIIDRAFDPEHPEMPIVLFDIPSGRSK